MKTCLPRASGAYSERPESHGICFPFGVVTKTIIALHFLQ